MLEILAMSFAESDSKSVHRVSKNKTNQTSERDNAQTRGVKCVCKYIHCNLYFVIFCDNLWYFGHAQMVGLFLDEPL